MTRTTQPLSK
ncbi:hypothetical protein Pint_22306 [Pistacia integerrima]|uniref:Uncharacterized protein n=1 Tax=Pistacia integerrima TaxID=434235 RepID=A0ACC0YLU6_9ROSI|nr:hypothetical protein Pint_22306 [Pistacia integerrima]